MYRVKLQNKGATSSKFTTIFRITSGIGPTRIRATWSSHRPSLSFFSDVESRDWRKSHKRVGGGSGNDALVRTVYRINSRKLLISYSVRTNAITTPGGECS